MLTKLALRNVKRQIGNYLIYFITVAVTVAMMFSINNVIFNDRLVELAEGADALRQGLTGVSVFVALVVAFVLGYATSFMLKLRRREFGAYLTLGMTRKNVLTIFMSETLFMGVLALAAGLAIGMLMYQGLMLLVSTLMEMPATLEGYSAQGLILTIVLVMSMFLVSSLASAAYLRRVSIRTLMEANDHSRGAARHPLLWCIVAAISLAAAVYCGIKAWTVARHAMLSGGDGIAMLYYAIGFCGFFGLLHTSLARGAMGLALRSKKIRASGTAIFTLRQLAGRLTSNSLMAGVLSVLLGLAMLFSNLSFMQQVSNEAVITRNYPFDVMACLPVNESLEADNGYTDAPPTIDEAEEIIQKYSEITWKQPFTIYNSGTSELTKLTDWESSADYGLCDSYIRESDFNALMEFLGLETINLEDEYFVLGNDAAVMDTDFTNCELKLNGMRLTFKGLTDKYPLLGHTYFLTIVPDAAVEGMTPESICEAMELANDDFDAQSLNDSVTWTWHSSDGYDIVNGMLEISAYYRAEVNGQSAMFIVGEMYVSIVFVMMAMAMLALKSLSSIQPDKVRYAALYRIGADERAQRHTLFVQTLAFFALPFVLPLLLNLPAAMISCEMLKMGGFSQCVPMARMCALGIVVISAIAYTLYFMATYLVARRNVICTELN